MFIGKYERRVIDSGGKKSGDFCFIHAVPSNFIAPEILPEVKEVSPSFELIYKQACKAESDQLTEVCGMGFRKSLEFLIKDYCTLKQPDEEDQIKSLFLGKVIKDYVDDNNLKNCAERAAWLGNDESHYVRKWETKDLNDLKILINLTCVWIRSDILTKQYMSDMS